MPGSNSQVIIEGIPSYDPLYVPLAAVSDLLGGYTVPLAGKLQNDAEHDMSTNLSTWPLITDLSGGFGRRKFDINDRGYHLPIVGSTSEGYPTGPLPWTLLSYAPLMPGAGWSAINGDLCLVDIEEFAAGIYAADAKGKKLMVLSAGAWAEQAGHGLTKAPTELFVKSDTNSAFLLVGQGTGEGGDGTFARKWTGSAWSNWTVAGVNTNAQHFALVAGNIWYTSLNKLREVTKANAIARNTQVGDPTYGINRIAWFGQDIVVGKPEGIYLYSPNTRVVTTLLDCASPNVLNGRCVVVHGGQAWFGAGEALYAYDGNAVREQTWLLFEGIGKQPWYSARIIDGWSDGRTLFLIVRTKSADATPVYDYFLVAYTNATGGYHPIFHLASTTAPTIEPGALLLASNQLHYAMSVDSNQKSLTGYLDTNGVVPMISGSNYFKKDIGITTGWWDGGRPTLTKWLKEVHVRVTDWGTAKGKIALYYQEPGGNWTLIGETTAGTQANEIIAIPVKAAETGAQKGITVTCCRFKIVLTNVDAQPLSAWRLDSLHLVGRVHYSPAYSCTFAVPIASAEAGGVTGQVRTTYDSTRVLAGLRAGIDTARAVKLTHPDKGVFYGHLIPVAGGDRLISAESMTGKPKIRQFRCAFLEAK